MMLLKWFSVNQIKISISKCHLVVNKTTNLSYNLWEQNLLRSSPGYIQKGTYENKKYEYRSKKYQKFQEIKIGTKLIKP